MSSLHCDVTQRRLPYTRIRLDTLVLKSGSKTADHAHADWAQHFGLWMALVWNLSPACLVTITALGRLKGMAEIQKANCRKLSIQISSEDLIISHTFSYASKFDCSPKYLKAFPNCTFSFVWRFEKPTLCYWYAHMDVAIFKIMLPANVVFRALLFGPEPSNQPTQWVT